MGNRDTLGGLLADVGCRITVKPGKSKQNTKSLTQIVGANHDGTR